MFCLNNREASNILLSPTMFKHNVKAMSHFSIFQGSLPNNGAVASSMNIGCSLSWAEWACALSIQHRPAESTATELMFHTHLSLPQSDVWDSSSKGLEWSGKETDPEQLSWSYQKNERPDSSTLAISKITRHGKVAKQMDFKEPEHGGGRWVPLVCVWQRKKEENVLACCFVATAYQVSTVF